VYDAHELETETYGLTGIKQWLARAIERLLIRTADLVIVVGDGIKHWYEKKYKLRNIVTVLNCPEFHRPERTELLHEKLGIPKNRRIVIYQGGLEPGRGIEQLLDVFSQLSDDHHVLVFMGFGTLEGLIKERGRESSNIYYQPAVEPASVLRYTASAHVGISYINNNSLNDYLCLPNKFFEYIMAGIPVIVNNVPEMRRVVTENSIGLVLPELTTRSLKEALKTIESWDVNMLKANLNRVAKLCAWENQSRAMIEAYKKHVFERA
jgi:glycosyltransferase involved in cell wall biosynthesis